jgi:hypothetical protein
LVKKYELSICLVRSNRSNPALKQHFGKARFLQKNIFDCGIKSEVVYAAKAKSEADIFSKTGCQPQCNGGADLSFLK